MIKIISKEKTDQNLLLQKMIQKTSIINHNHKIFNNNKIIMLIKMNLLIKPSKKKNLNIFLIENLIKIELMSLIGSNMINKKI